MQACEMCEGAGETRKKKEQGRAALACMNEEKPTKRRPSQAPKSPYKSPQQTVTWPLHDEHFISLQALASLKNTSPCVVL